MILLALLLPSFAPAATKVSFPFTPISAASLPWWIAKESRFYEKYGLDVDMIYVGASPVIVQAMLGGQAGVGAGGGPPLVSNILQGGDVVEVATTVPYAIQSLIVKADIRTPAELAGKKIGISRLGAIPHFTLQAIVKLYNVQGINIVQTGTTTQAITSLAQGLVDGIITSAPFTFRLVKNGYRELVSPEGFQKGRCGVFDSRLGRAKKLRREKSGSSDRHDQGHDGRREANFCQRETGKSRLGQVHAPNRPGNLGSDA
jgi:ABC-type nitrate/sulfonate/bicarbonate transport system substrate-binding protein